MKKSIISIISIVSVLITSFSVSAAELPRESAPYNAANEAIIFVESYIGDIFYFGSKSKFDDLCHKVITEIKGKYPHIKRIYVRSAFQHIPDWYEESLLKNYEDTYFPEQI